MIKHQFTRREFIKTTVIAASGIAIIGLSGCGDDNDHSSSPKYFPQSVMSGDPKEDSIILWTRVADSQASGDLNLTVDVATDESLSAKVVDGVTVVAEETHDHCVKVKVTGLTAGQIYYYRFRYSKDGKQYASAIGRTKTAPSADTDVTVKYAFLSCQDYIGKYYNTLAWLVENDPDGELDFIVYLGDYIYETSGDPTFQSADNKRTITFSDTSGAIELTASDGTIYYGASSLSNYRDLYKTYRSDSQLQQLQELYPVIGIWDDHEYTDDCHSDTATYFNGLNDSIDEHNTARRQRAEQVWYEYMPVDTSSSTDTGAFTTEEDQIFGGSNSQGIYRDFRFGQHLHLALTDYRSFRPDHLIPEDAFPGSVVLDKDALITVFDVQTGGYGATAYEGYKESFGPYINIDDDSWSAYKEVLIGVLTQAYVSDGLDASSAATKATSDVSGNISAYVFNLLITQYNTATGSSLPIIDDETYNALDRGIAYLHFGKGENFSEFGSRYGTVKATYDLYAAYRVIVAAQSAGLDLTDSTQAATAAVLAENVFDSTTTASEGTTPQFNWLKNIVSSSDATYLCVGSSVSTISLLWDLSAQTALPADYQNIFYANVDHWDGFPNMRDVLIGMLKERGNSFIIAGDIHSSFVAEHKDDGDTNAVADFTGTSVTSTTFNGFLRQALPAITSSFTEEQQSLAEDLLVTNLDATLLSGFDKMKFANTTSNGFVLVTVSADQVQADYHLISEEEVTTNYYDDVSTLESKFTQQSFIFNGSEVVVN